MLLRQNLDWLTLIAAARARRDARLVLDIAQGLRGEAWNKWQQGMINRLRPN